MSANPFLTFSRTAVAAAAAIVLAAPALAQNTTAALGGRIVGSDGKPVSGATVSIQHVESRSVSTTTTDVEGRYSARGLVVLGFPSNDFGQQEPGDSRQIADLCFNTYAVRFPMFARTRVIGPQANGLHAALGSQAGSPKWNFHKYLINRDATQVIAYTSFTKPDDKDLLKKIDEFLK